MSSDDRFSFLLTALVAAAVILGASQMARPRGGGLPDPPRVGTIGAAVMGPALAESDSSVEPGPDERALVAERVVLQVLGASPWPSFARTVVFHPLSGAALGGEGLEQGPPYHLVIEPDGAIRWTDRGRSGGPSQPPGLPAAVATKALHVAMPASGRVTAERVLTARILWREAARRLGERTVMFADEVPGSTARLPDGFDRNAYVAAQETQPKETRPASQASQPAAASDRVKIRFGSTTIDAGLAARAAARREGLMGRTSLRQDEGLLFVYRDADYRSFWMKGCLIQLDILYLKDDGEVLEVRTLDPPNPKLSEADLPRFASPAPCRLVLEVAGGYALAHGMKKGSRLALPENLPQVMAKADP